MLAETVAISAPPHLAAEIATGAVYRVGTLLFRHGQAGIIAHMQETGLAQQAVSSLLQGSATGATGLLGTLAAGPPGVALAAATKVAELGLQGYTVAQNAQIKTAIASLQSLQLASLAISGVGIGVSIAGFAILSQKIGRISDQVNAMDARLELVAKRIEELRHENVQEDFDRLRTACEQMDEAWKLADPEPQWRSAAQALHGLQNRFARRVRRIVIETEDIIDAEPFVEAFALAGASRVSSRLAAGDTAAARDASEAFAREFAEITTPIGTATLLTSQLRGEGILPGDNRYVMRAERLRPDAEATAATFREREAVAASTPLTLQRLEQLDISGRSWLEAARNETGEPLLFLAGERG